MHGDKAILWNTGVFELTWLLASDFIELCHCENFKTYIHSAFK